MLAYLCIGRKRIGLNLVSRSPLYFADGSESLMYLGVAE